MKKVLITGGAGFIGCNLAKRLQNDGYKVYIIDNLSRGKMKYLQELELDTSVLIEDLRNYRETCGAFKAIIGSEPKRNIHSVFHCASRIGGMQFLHGSPEKEYQALSDNLSIDRNVFRACHKFKVKNIIYTSSVSVYNTQVQYEGSPIFSEGDFYRDIDPEGGYGWAKYIGEKQLEYLSLIGHKVGVARIFKSYGPYDDYSLESGQVVLSLMRKILEGSETLQVWGDGSAERNYLFIDDLVDALIKLQDLPNSLTVNLGGDKSVTVKELVEEILAISGSHIPAIYGTADQNGPQTREPNLSRARNELGWIPSDNWSDGLRKTWEWMRDEIS